MSPAARLARVVAADDVIHEALATALELSGCESGLIALTDGHGALYPHVVDGPFAVAFSQLAAEELAALAAWVDDATSSFTVGDTAGRGFNGHEVLRRAGAASLIVVPLTAAGERRGLLVLADRANRRPEAETIEFLELLGSIAGHHEPERVGPGGHALEPAGDELAITVDLANAADGDDAALEVRDLPLTLDRLRP